MDWTGTFFDFHEKNEETRYYCSSFIGTYMCDKQFTDKKYI